MHTSRVTQMALSFISTLFQVKLSPPMIVSKKVLMPSNSDFSANRFKLNRDKTEIVCCLSSKQCVSFPELSLSVGNVTVQPTKSVRNLGVQIRSVQSRADQTSMVGRSCFYSIRKLRSVRRSLDREALAQMQLVLYRIDFSIRFTPDFHCLSQDDCR